MRIVIVAKAPLPGLTNTRLIPALGAAGAAALQQRMIYHTLVTVALSGMRAQLWCYPDPRHPFFAACAREFALTLHSQQGADLGARMHHALASGPAGDPAVLIGTDCPALAVADLHQACRMLEDGEDAVLGPAVDGGYYLIGLRRPCAGLFANMAWGTDRVLAETRARLCTAAYRWHELAQRHDIDTPEDLVHLAGGLWGRESE